MSGKLPQLLQGMHRDVVARLAVGGRYAEAAHLRLLADCADICQTSASFLMRGSERHASVCAVCAEICTRCAEQCERFADDEWMKVCATACRHCAESCQTMSA